MASILQAVRKTYRVRHAMHSNSFEHVQCFDVVISISFASSIGCIEARTESQVNGFSTLKTDRD